MFTGLVDSTGAVVSRTAGAGATRLIIAAPRLAGRWRTGDSIAVNGVCLTALPVPELASSVSELKTLEQEREASTSASSWAPGTEVRGDPASGSAASDPTHFAADLAAETITRTTLGSLHTGAIVNLELPTPAGSPLGGHVVQGHVDGVGRMRSLVAIHPELAGTDWRLTLELPPALVAQVVPQGSITVEGISLTVARLVVPPDPDGAPSLVEIAVIPHTYKSTNLHALPPGSAVNIETDVLAKYAARQGVPTQPAQWLTAGYLLANGY